MLLYQRHGGDPPTTFDIAENYWKYNILRIYFCEETCEKINSDLEPGKSYDFIELFFINET